MRIFLLLLLMAVPSYGQLTSTSHVIPVVADGLLGDTIAYQSSFLITNVDQSAGSCSLTLKGGLANTRLALNPGMALESLGTATNITTGVAGFATGYATLTCTVRVVVNTVYVFTDPTGIRSMATVFSTRAFNGASLLAPYHDPEVGARLGVAVANDSDSSASFQLVVNISGTTVAKAFSLPPRSSSSKFLDELLTIPPGGRVIAVSINAPAQPIHAIGLFFWGDTFTTIPPTIF